MKQRCSDGAQLANWGFANEYLCIAAGCNPRLWRIHLYVGIQHRYTYIQFAEMRHRDA